MGNNSYKVYLAGGITGLVYGEATDWREWTKEQLKDLGIDAYSPMRSKRYLQNNGNRTDDDGKIKDSYEEHPLSCKRGIMSRDFFDTKRADLLLVNLLGAPRVSIGTCMEIAWAFAMQKPTVICMEASGNVHEHCMLSEATSFRVATLEEGIEIVKQVLLP